ncbi:DUF2339 domain-containing protein [Rhodococcus sp. NPDC004095]
MSTPTCAPMLGPMVNPCGSQIDPQLVARLSGQFSALGQHLHEVAADLTRLRSQLEVSAPQPVQSSAPMPMPMPMPTAAPQATPMQHPAAVPYPVQPTYPAQAMYVAQPPRPPGPAVSQPVPVAGSDPTRSASPPRRDPWWQRDGLVSRVLAVAGAAVTLIGVVMLLVLAAQAGFFGPVARVVAGAVFSGALVGAGLRVFGRSGGRVGGIALAGTGIAGGFLDVVAATTYYGWLPPALGLALAAAIAAGGMVLATRWRSQPMAALVVLAVAALAPALADGLTIGLLAFLVLLQIAGFAPQLGRDWPYLHAARTIPVVVALLAAFASVSWGGGGWWDGVNGPVAALIALAATVAVVGVGTSLIVVRRRADDVTATAMLAASTLPLLLSGGVLARWTEVAVQCTLAAALLGVLATVPALPGHTRVALSAVAAVAVLQASIGATPGDALPVTLLVLALGLVTAGARSRSRIAFLIGFGFAALGGLLFVEAAPPAALATAADAPSSLAVIASGMLLAAVTVLLVVHARGVGLPAADRTDAAWVAAGVVTVYAGTAAVVAAGVAALGAQPGFIAGHCAATLSWMVLASAMLRWGLTHPERTHLALGAGLAVTGAALAKLFLFDLATLDGVFRVLAFIGVGLLLLAAGTRYARAFATGAQREQPGI